MMIKLFSVLSSLGLATAFAPASLRQQQPTTSSLRVADTETIFDQEQFIAEGREMRLKHLEEQAMFALKIACENYGTCCHTFLYAVEGGNRCASTGDSLSAPPLFIVISGPTLIIY
jgi:hypothetical protein